MDKELEAINEIFIYFKKEIIRDVSSLIKTYELEYFNGLFIHQKDRRIELINEEIIQLNEVINKNFPFVSYNFVDGVFMEDSSFLDAFIFEEDCIQEMLRLDLKNDIHTKLATLFRNTILPDRDKACFRNTPIYNLYNEIQTDLYEGKKLEFLILKRDELIGGVSIKVNSNEIDNNLQWYGSKTELIELTKALIENGSLKGKQEKIFESIQKVFNFELKNIDQAITKFNTRHPETETKFLDKLKKSLVQYISNKLNKKR